MPPLKLRKSPRLKAFDYGGRYAYNLTFVTRGRKPVFAQRHLVEKCLAGLQTSAERNGVDVLAYCFMPDHLHLLVSASETGPPPSSHFKQLSGYRFKQERGEHPWQVSYYDHVVRREETLEKIADYIWHNPVRAGLCGRASDYPFSGPKESLEEPAAPWQV